MKKLLLLLLVASSLQAQQAQEKADEVVISHMNYKTTFSKHHRYPTHVEWWVTRAKLECKNPVSRTDKFLPDPQLRKDSDIDDDYVKSWFDRGHLSPAADARCNITHMAESFYFTNMAPQYPGLNRGQWKNLEEWTRHLATEHDSVFVEAGCVGEAMRIKRVAVPTHCWKIIYVKKTGEKKHYVFPNVPERSKSFEIHEVTPDSIRKLRKRP